MNDQNQLMTGNVTVSSTCIKTLKTQITPNVVLIPTATIGSRTLLSIVDTARIQ